VLLREVGVTDIGTGFLQGIEAFVNSRLGHMTESTWQDTGPFLGAIVTFDTPARKTAFEQLKADIEAMEPVFEAIGKKIKKQTELIKKMVDESKADIDSDDFNVDVAARVAIRIGMALAAADEAYNVIATELAKDAAGTVDENIRQGLMGLWDPWAQPFKNLGADAGNLLNKFGNLFGIDDLRGDLSKVIVLDREGGGFKLVAKIAKSGSVQLGALTLDQVSFEAFLQFSDREVANPTEAEKQRLVQRGDKYYIGDVAILGLRLRTLLEPGLTSDPLLARVMPGSQAPQTTTITAVSLDTAQGFYIGDGRANEKAVLPVRYSFPGVELREMALGLVRNPAREVTAFEITTSIAAAMGDAVGMQIVGSGFVVTPTGATEQQAVFEMPVSPRWPDAIGLRIKAGPITGGGFIQRVERTYKVNGQDVKRIEFGGVIQLQIMSFGVSAIVILSPDPFSLVLVIGIRFPTGIDIGLGFTLNGIGGILALDRGLSLEALRAGMSEHILDKMLFPDNPVAEAPKLLDKVANVFPPQAGGFVVGPIVELGWGSQAKFVEMKLGVVLALPDPMVVVLGSLRVRVPSKEAAITDIRADLFVAITPDYLLLFASMRDSKIGAFKVSGDLGLYIQWSGSGAFEFSVGGFHPEYEKLTGSKPKLGQMDRLTIDLSPAKAIRFVIKGYFAITAGSVQLGVDGRFTADFEVIVAKAWLTLDMIFIWSPRFAFKVSIEVGVEVELLGFTFCSIVFRGSLEGTRPFKLAGHIKVDVWFLPTFDEDLGPITWGDEQPPALPKVDALAIVAAALNEDDAWKVSLPEHAAQLVTLAEVDDVAGRIAHPMAGLEVCQTQVPLGVKISHIGSSPVKANMVTIGTPSSSAGEMAAISEARTGFPPGHFFDLEGEKLLARSGFEDLQGGCRMATATTPKLGASAQENVAYRTYVRDPNDSLKAALTEWTFARLSGAHAAASSIGRAARVSGNPYLAKKPVEPPVSITPHGTSTLTDAATGATLLDGVGAMSATEAGAILDAISDAGLSGATRTTVRG
jgi:Family of unknown function (DUF6603)